MLFSFLAAVALQAAPADSARVAVDPAVLATAYVDEGARDLVERARDRRRAVDGSIGEYEATVRERLSASIRAGWLERLAYRRETTARIHWRRDAPAVMEVLGAREVAPVTGVGMSVPGDLDGQTMDELMANLVFDPAEDAELLRWGDSSFVRHPLGPGAEAHYRYRSGDTIEVRLPAGRVIRAIELEILPRRESERTIRGSFWLDAGSHAIVRAAFRLSRDIRLNFSIRASRGGGAADSAGAGAAGDAGDSVAAGEPTSEAAAPDSATPVRSRGLEVRARSREMRPDTAADDGDSPPLLLRLAFAALPDLDVKPRYVTIEYGLWEGTWWLPRLVALEGVVQASGVSVRVGYERRYDGYRVAAEPVSDASPASVAGAAPITPESSGGDLELVVVLPDDTASLMTSESLPPDVYGDEAWLITDAQRAALLAEIAALSGFDADAGSPWRLDGSEIDWDPLLRYNRVEELSVGVGAASDLGPIAVSAAARLGTGDVEPRGMLSVAREGSGAEYELTGYRRLATMDPRAEAFSNVASASALLFGYDEPDYYDQLGVSLAGRPLAAERQWYEWRVYARRERAVRKETDASVPRLFDRDRRFRANPAAAEALQYGAGLALRTWRGRDPDGLRWGGVLGLDVATGDFAYARPSLALRSTFPLPGPFVGLLEGEAGAVWGEPALQHLRRAGGAHSVRGYHGSAMVGEASWRARAELATRLPAARLILFADAGWAGPREAFGQGDPLVSAGLAAGFLDGFVRIDIARALVAPEGWWVGVHLDGLP